MHGPQDELPWRRAAAVVTGLTMLLIVDVHGVAFYCAPTVDDRETWPVTMRHIALEGRCFVLSAVQHTETIRGGSLIVSPLGKLLAGPCYDGECILRAEVDPGEIAEGKFDLDVAGHYARPDVFRLHVDEGCKIEPDERRRE